MKSFRSKFGRFNGKGWYSTLARILYALFKFPTPNANTATFEDGLNGWAFAPGTANPSFNDYTVADGTATITLPSTLSFDPGTTTGSAGSGCPRFERAVSGDFVLYASYAFDPQSSKAQFTGTGFYLKSATSSARLDIYVRETDHSPRSYIKYGGTVTQPNPPPAPSVSIQTKYGFPSHQKIERSGTTFTFSASYDGINWVQVSSFTWAEDVTMVGTTFYHITPNGKDTVVKLKHLSFDTPYIPQVNAKPTRNVVLSEDFTDLSAFVDGSQNGGSATVSGNVLTLTCTDPDRSTGRISSVATYAKNVGMTFRVRRPTTGKPALYFGAGLRGREIDGAVWGTQYSAPIATLFEAHHATDLYRVVRCARSQAGVPDGGMWTYMFQKNEAALNLAVWTRIRFENIGPYILTKIWADGNPEPENWSSVVIDYSNSEPGKIGFAISHNDGAPDTDSVLIADLEVYEFSDTSSVNEYI